MSNQNLSERVWFYNPDMPETPESTSSDKLGDVISSSLTFEQIEALYPKKFAQFAGQSITGTDLHKLTGIDTLPDLSGCFFRQVGGLAKDCLTVQEDQTDCSSLSFLMTGRWQSSGSFNHRHQTLAIADGNAALTSSNYAAAKSSGMYSVIQWNYVDRLPAKTHNPIPATVQTSSKSAIRGNLISAYGDVETRPKNIAMFHYIVVNR